LPNIAYIRWPKACEPLLSLNINHLLGTFGKFTQSKLKDLFDFVLSFLPFGTLGFIVSGRRKKVILSIASTLINMDRVLRAYVWPRLKPRPKLKKVFLRQFYFIFPAFELSRQDEFNIEP
jgi:hypothetical protein